MRWSIPVVVFLLSLTSAYAQNVVDPQHKNPDAIAFPANFFPILPWDQMHALEGDADRRSGLGSTGECGFTIAGFVPAKDLPVCERLGLKAIVYPDAALKIADRHNELTDQQIDENVRQLAEATRESPACIGYYIRDEPGATHFAYLAKIVSAVKKHAPGKLAYINLFPGYATLGATDTSQLQTATFTEYLERYVREVHPQFISYDNYMVQYSQDLHEAGQAAAYFRDLIEVRRVALEHGLPFWNIVSSNQIRPTSSIPSPANMLLQAWTTLAAGGRGVSWYKYSGVKGYEYSPLDVAGRRSVTWSYLQMVNRQLGVIGPIVNTLKSTGIYFAGPMAMDAPKLPGRIVRAVDANARAMIGEFESHDGLGHVIVVNLSLSKSAKIKMDLVDARPLEMYSPVDGSVGPVNREFWLAAGQGVLLRMK